MFIMISLYCLLGILVLHCINKYNKDDRIAHIVFMSIIAALVAMAFQNAALGTSLSQYMFVVFLSFLLFFVFLIASLVLRAKTEFVYDGAICEKMYVGLVSITITFFVIAILTMVNAVLIKLS